MNLTYFSHMFRGKLKKSTTSLLSKSSYFNARRNILLIDMRGLCHICFRSNLDLVISKGNILCQECFEKQNAKN